jgi:hypothetical protein
MARTLMDTLIAYTDALRTAIQAYNDYSWFRHQSARNLRCSGLDRRQIANEVFRKHYGS